MTSHDEHTKTESQDKWQKCYESNIYNINVKNAMRVTYITQMLKMISLIKL